MSQGSETEIDSNFTTIPEICFQLQKFEQRNSKTEKQLLHTTSLLNRLQDENSQLKEYNTSIDQNYADALTALASAKKELAQKNELNTELRKDNDRLRKTLGDEESLSATRLDLCTELRERLQTLEKLLNNYKHHTAALESVWQRIRSNAVAISSNDSQSHVCGNSAEDTPVGEVQNLRRTLTRSLKRPNRISRTRVKDKSESFPLSTQFGPPSQSTATVHDFSGVSSQKDIDENNSCDFSQNIPSCRRGRCRKASQQQVGILGESNERVQKSITPDDQIYPSMSPQLPTEEACTENYSEGIPPSPEFKTNFAYSRVFSRSDRKRKEGSMSHDAACNFGKKLLLSPDEQQRAVKYTSGAQVSPFNSTRKSETPNVKISNDIACTHAQILGHNLQTTCPDCRQRSNLVCKIPARHSSPRDASTVTGRTAINMDKWELDLPDTQTDPQQRHLRDCPTNIKKVAAVEDSETQTHHLFAPGDHGTDHKLSDIPKTTGWIKI
eukprot:m.578602 g.578602  ORF g.578602 m.578602 type:complete len:497 (-) comp22308_c0_seq8:864-2354(-)